MGRPWQGHPLRGECGCFESRSISCVDPIGTESTQCDCGPDWDSCAESGSQVHEILIEGWRWRCMLGCARAVLRWSTEDSDARIRDIALSLVSRRCVREKSVRHYTCQIRHKHQLLCCGGRRSRRNLRNEHRRRLSRCVDGRWWRRLEVDWARSRGCAVILKRANHGLYAGAFGADMTVTGSLQRHRRQ